MDVKRLPFLSESHQSEGAKRQTQKCQQIPPDTLLIAPHKYELPFAVPLWQLPLVPLKTLMRPPIPLLQEGCLVTFLGSPTFSFRLYFPDFPTIL